MNIREILETLEKFELNEIAIKPWRALPSKRNPKDCVKAIENENSDRIKQLLNCRKDRQLPPKDPKEDEHRVGCQSKYKLFNYNGKDYYFGILWGEEDQPTKDNSSTLKGNGLAHIIVNHGSNFQNVINNLNLAITQMKPNMIFKDKKGNLEIDVKIGKLKYVFKNYQELNDNYFYLHTAW